MTEGKTYTSESINRVRFAAPDTVKHTVISARSSFPGDSQEGMVMNYLNMSFYESDNELYISPLSPQALRHYNFRYEGFIDDGQYTVNCIKVIPKRKSQQLWEGNLYKIEKLWCIHSVNMSLNLFLGKIKINQLYSEVKDKVWLPVTNIFDINFDMFGVQMDYVYTGAVKYLSVNTNETQKIKVLEIQGTAVDEKEGVDKKENLSKNQKKIDEILSKDEMSNRDMTKLAGLIEKENKIDKKDIELEIKNNVKFEIQKDSLKRDSLYWNSIRPIPLTISEKSGFDKKDSIANITVQEDTTKITKKRSKFVKVTSKILVGGRIGGNAHNAQVVSVNGGSVDYYDFGQNDTIPVKKLDLRLRYSGLITWKELKFNPVDGFRYGQNINISWKQSANHWLRISLNGGYAFSREAFDGQINIYQNYLPLRRGSVSVTGNIGSKDFSSENAVHPIIYMASSLLLKENYPRYFEDKSITVKNSIDLSNGLLFDFSGSYFWADTLKNNTNFSFFYQNKDYKPNEIVTVDNNHLKKQQTFFLKAKLNYTPYQRYYISKGNKIDTSSDYPTFTLCLEQGIKAFSSEANYLLAEIGAFKNADDFSFRPTFSWDINAGWFIINDRIHFSRFKHFNAVTIPLLTKDFTKGFYLIDRYEASTDQWFVRANGTYSSPYLMIKYLPFFSNRLWNENLHIGYIYTPDYKNYTQIGYSISRIFMVGNIGIFAGFRNLKYQHWGVRISLSMF
jgi:hypothetical protein